MRRRTRLEQGLGFRFRDEGLRVTSLTHRSFAFERGSGDTNERLEFLGDAVLGLVVTDLAYRRFPDLPEGELAKLRAAIVNMATLADVARDLGIGEEVLLGRGEARSGGAQKASILADALEAVIGALYLDRGLVAARKFIERVFWPRMLAYAQGRGPRDHKTGLQELAAQSSGVVPQYRVTERGPDHAKRFTAVVLLGGEPYGSGEGTSKKEAEQQAAREAFERLTDEGRTVAAGEG
ncbi:MAG TPA: ribonuclease III [Actinomycetota bacterium]|nr:ribonuclease III [Actinomycetota bacterium]